MQLTSLSIINYRNIATATLELSGGINCFLGRNGAGKTNLLDAVYYLSFCKSFLGCQDSQNIRDGEKMMMIQGRYERAEAEEIIYCGVKRGQKKQFRRNRKDYVKISDHIGLLPLVIISPADEELIYGSSEERRRYIDSIISQCDPQYLDAVVRYNNAVRQRNALLKQFEGQMPADWSLIEIIDLQLADLGNRIYGARCRFAEWLEPIFTDFYHLISGGTEDVAIRYVSGLQRYDFADGLRETLARDVALGYTSRGIHKDELDFTLKGLPLRKTGSQGQKKSFAIAMRLAQFRYLTQHNGFRPILLLDDVFDKLDSDRAANLIGLVAGDTFDQIFITDTDRRHLLEILAQVNKKYRIFDVDNGLVTESQNQ